MTEHVQIRIMRLLEEQDMRLRDIVRETGVNDLYWHLRRLASFGYISREKRNKRTYYSLKDEGRECLNQGDFPGIRQVKPFAEVITPLMASDSYTPMTARELHATMQDPRPPEQFHSLLAHLVQRGYVLADKTSTLQRYYLTERGREYAQDPVKFRHEKRKRRFQ